MRVIAAFLLGAASLGLAQTRITSVEGITEYRLDNGLDVLLFPEKTKPQVTVNVTYLVGSRQEGYGETGMAHLLEHMLYKGTTHRRDIKIELADHGANFNGSTWYDRTNYFETLEGSEANLKWALEMEADRMVNSRIAQADLNSEMTVVRSEFEQGENSPDRVLEERVLSTAYLWHAYGRSTIGTRSDIEHVPIDKLQAFYRNYYQPDNAVLVVAGSFDAAKALEYIKASFGAIPRPSRKLSPPYTTEPAQDGEREVVLRRPGDSQAVMAAYHIPAGPHPDFAALEVLEQILDAQPAGRLYRALVETKQAVSISGDTFQLHDPGIAVYSAQLRKDGSLANVEKTLLSVIAAVAKEPPSKEEVDRARTHLMKNIDLDLASSQNIGIALSEWASMGDWRLLFLDRDRIAKVTPEDVVRVAKLYFKPSNRTIGRFIPVAQPDRAEIPPTPDVATMLSDYQGRAATGDGEEFDPSFANIEARTKRTTLANGMKLALLSKKTRGETVSAILTMQYGDEKSLTGKDAAAQFTAAILMRGTRKHTRQQLQDELDRLKAQMSVAGSAAGGVTISISTVRSGFAGALRLAAEVLREPAFPEADFEQLKQTNIGRVEAQRGEPQTLVVNTMNRHLNPYPPGDPLAITTFGEAIDGMKKLTLDDVRNFHARFYGASHAEVGAVGDFDTPEIQKVAAEVLGDWKSAAPYTPLQRTWKKLDPIHQSIETPDKANSFFEAGLSMKLNEADPDYPALLFANTMIGGGSRSHLFLRIREKEGLSYAVQSVFEAGVEEQFGQFLAVAISNPENMAKVEAAFKDEMGKLLTDGFAADEVETAKTALLQQEQVLRSQDGFLARRLALQGQFGWTMTRDAELDRKIAGLTAADVNAVLKRHIDMAAMSYVEGGDFKKAGVKP